MFGHFPELVIVLGIALIVFGPEKLPEVASTTGRVVREMRQIMDDALHPQARPVPDDFEAYYYESMRRAGEDVPGDEEGAEVGVTDYESEYATDVVDMAGAETAGHVDPVAEAEPAGHVDHVAGEEE